METVGLCMKGIDSQQESLWDENRTLRNANSQLEGKEKMNPLARHQIQTERDAKKLNFVATDLTFDSPHEGYSQLQKINDAHSESKIRITGQRVINLGGRKKIIGTCDNLADKKTLMSIKKELVTDVNEEKSCIFLDNDKPYRLVRMAAKDLKAKGKDVRIKSGMVKVDGV